MRWGFRRVLICIYLLVDIDNDIIASVGHVGVDCVCDAVSLLELELFGQIASAVGGRVDTERAATLERASWFGHVIYRRPGSNLVISFVALQTNVTMKSIPISDSQLIILTVDVETARNTSESSRLDL